MLDVAEVGAAPRRGAGRPAPRPAFFGLADAARPHVESLAEVAREKAFDLAELAIDAARPHAETAAEVAKHRAEQARGGRLAGTARERVREAA